MIKMSFNSRGEACIVRQEGRKEATTKELEGFDSIPGTQAGGGGGVSLAEPFFFPFFFSLCCFSVEITDRSISKSALEKKKEQQRI